MHWYKVSSPSPLRQADATAWYKDVSPWLSMVLTSVTQLVRKLGSALLSPRATTSNIRAKYLWNCVKPIRSTLTSIISSWCDAHSLLVIGTVSVCCFKFPFDGRLLIATDSSLTKSFLPSSLENSPSASIFDLSPNVSCCEKNTNTDILLRF